MSQRRVSRIVAGGAFAAAVFGGGWWAGQAVLPAPSAPGTGGAPATTSEVFPATVGRTLTFGTTVTQPFEPVAANFLAGVVTSSTDQTVANAGDELYAVSAVPVRVVEGEAPFYRDLVRGTRGDDVGQLQRALLELGYLTGTGDGLFGSETESAVKRWQRDSGLTQSGVITLGELIAVPELPATVRVGTSLTPGAVATGGEEAVSVRAGGMAFAMVLTPEQASLIPSQAEITVTWEDRGWPATIAGQRTDEAGQVVLALTSPAGEAVCESECSVLPVQETLTMTAEVAIVPRVEGNGVPVASIRVGPDGSTYVELADGTRADVTVLGSSGGVAVVEGVSEGQRVRIPSDVDSPVSSGSSTGG